MLERRADIQRSLSRARLQLAQGRSNESVQGGELGGKAKIGGKRKSPSGGVLGTEERPESFWHMDDPLRHPLERRNFDRKGKPITFNPKIY